MTSKDWRKYTAEQVREALAKSGTKSGAATILNCSRNTIQRYCDEDPELLGAIQEARNALLDIAENALMKNVKKDHPASVFFTLKTLGKSRGYVERIESTGKDGAPIEIDHTINNKKTRDAIDKLTTGSKED